MKIISFIPKDNEVKDYIDKPKPSKYYLPEWYKKSEAYIHGDRLVVDDYATNAGLKHCVSFLDGMINGYIIELWTDIYVSITDDGAPKLSWTNTPDPVKTRHPLLGSKVPRPIGYDSGMLNWNMPFGIKMPKGYSVLMIHPLNRDDLPFRTLGGIVDSDSYFGEGAVPFFIQQGFQGIIPKGTPILQIIPIKRDSWFSKKSSRLMKARDKHQWMLRTSVIGYYKKFFRKDKRFE